MSTSPAFVTRKFPPAVGGMETLAANVWRGVEGADPDAVLIAHGGSLPATVLWLPGAIIRLGVLIARKRVGMVLCGDVLLYAVIGPLLRLTRTPHAVMAMGLDVTYDNGVYRRTVLPGLRRAPSVLAISRATAAAVRDVGVAPDRIVVLSLGLPDPGAGPQQRAATRAELRRRLSLAPDTQIVLTLGRLVPRKGVAWFMEHVFEDLPAEVHLVVAGDGPDRAAIDQLARRSPGASRIHVLGRVDDRLRDLLMRGADVFVQPNIEVPGDMEGFGLVAIEAAMNGSLVVASDLEGLRDAVDDGRTGFLVPAGDTTAWVARVREVLADPASLEADAERFRRTCVQRSSLAVMQRQLLEQLEFAR